MELHSTCGSNSLRQLPILNLLIHTRQEESSYGWMVATDPSEDTELPTTRLQMTSVPCLGLILRCLSFYTFIPFYGLCFPLQTITAHIPLYDYIFDVDVHPYVHPDSFLLFFLVLLTFYSHDITLPLFLIIHLSHDSAFCLQIILTLLLAFVFPSDQITESSDSYR